MEHSQQEDEVEYLNMQYTPQDAYDMLGFVVQSSDPPEKLKVQRGKLTLIKQGGGQMAPLVRKLRFIWNQTSIGPQTSL